MPLLPTATVQASVASELEAARAWAARRGYELHYDEQDLSLRLSLCDREGERYLLVGTFEDYPTLPPIWRFVHPDTGEPIGRAGYPAPVMPSPRQSPLVIEGGQDGAVICAHFNRLAFTEAGGPHGDWGALTNWQSAQAGQYAVAATIADMLARIELEVSDSSGRKAGLP